MHSIRTMTTDKFFSILLAGAIVGIVTLISSVSFAALIFSGKLSPFIASGITALVSTVVVAGYGWCGRGVALPQSERRSPDLLPHL